jgi:hypothetical protein
MTELRINMASRTIEDIQQQAKVLKPFLSPEKQERVDELIQTMLELKSATESELAELIALLIPEEITKCPSHHTMRYYVPPREEENSEEHWTAVWHAIEQLSRYMQRYAPENVYTIQAHKKGGQSRG